MIAAGGFEYFPSAPLFAVGFGMKLRWHFPPHQFGLPSGSSCSQKLHELHDLHRNEGAAKRSVINAIGRKTRRRDVNQCFGAGADALSYSIVLLNFPPNSSEEAVELTGSQSMRVDTSAERQQWRWW